ncbi:tRNA (cytosine-5-)-methyltransferase [Apophysomyces sp. BC1021]|nr:tRNA (cytosine-5-)-methyltransferase [Apophysomyces sp. BC1021]
MEQLKVLEFYSGIGGMHYAANAAGWDYKILKAFDINTVSNEIYAHNFGAKTIGQNLIETLSAEFYDGLAADVWTMSPPCQPYTRIGLQQGSKDPRAKSFLHLLDVLEKLKNRPKYIVVENVKGFEESTSRDMLVQQLEQCDYSYQEFLLTPLQLGIPNSRMRYYLLAKLKPLQFAQAPTKTIINHIPFSLRMAEEFVDSRQTPISHEQQLVSESTVAIEPVSKYLEHLDKPDIYMVPDKVLEKNGHVFDIVKPESQRSCCFTKGYFHYAQGTGSILQMNVGANTTTVFEQALQFKNNGEKSKMLSLLHTLKLRYFTPREVANLMGFPETFTFPDSSSQKQRYRTLGNSINVQLVAELMKYLQGGIVDKLPVMYDASLNHPVAPSRGYAMVPSRTICESCQQNQTLIYQIMSDYIRDESDPEFEYYMNTADQYQASLHAKYPLCNDCQTEVDDLVAQQKLALRQRRINERVQQSRETKPPHKPSKYRYWFHGGLWFDDFLSQTDDDNQSAYIYPPSSLEITDHLLADVKMYAAALMDFLLRIAARRHEERFSEIVADLLHDAVKQEIVLIKSLGQTFLCLIPFSSWFGESECQWISLEYVLIHNSAAYSEDLVFLAASPGAYTWLCQYRKDTFLDEGIINMLSNVFSVFHVKTTRVEWPARPVGKEGSFDTLKKTYSDLQAYTKEKFAKIGKLSREAAYYAPYPKEEAAKEKEMGFSGPSTLVSSNDKRGFRLEEDRDLDGIVDGLYKIYM